MGGIYINAFIFIHELKKLFSSVMDGIYINAFIFGHELFKKIICIIDIHDLSKYIQLALSFFNGIHINTFNISYLDTSCINKFICIIY